MKGPGSRDASSDYTTTNKSGSKTSALVRWWAAMVAAAPPKTSPSPGRPPLVPCRFTIFLLIGLSIIYFLYTTNLLISSSFHHHHQHIHCPSVLHLSSDPSSRPPPPPIASSSSAAAAAAAPPTGLQHIVFGIAASARLWGKRREYIKVWWRPGRMRGYVWLDKPVSEPNASSALPAIKISADTSRFPYTHRQGHRAAIRISRIVSETVRLLGPRDAAATRWIVMGDDDTVFLPDNLVGVLAQFDHTQPYYIGSLSESHLQNIYFSYSMAYGGGGFAISWPLAVELEKFQDRCIRRYPALYGSDDRMQACMAELGVPLTRHPGFHQYDVYGNLEGLLSAHPVAPLVSLHHLDIVQPIFPAVPDRAAAIRRLFEGPVRLDSAGVIQQSICYDAEKKWTVSVSWGFAVQVVRGVMSPREMEMPARTFLNWYRRADYTAYAFNTRPVARNPCQKPFMYYYASARHDTEHGTTVTRYARRKEAHPLCRWKMADPSALVDHIIVYKKPDPDRWQRSPRRDCCRVLPTKEEKTLAVDVGVCRAGEISEI